MSSRLGGALADHIRRIPGRSRFILVEGVPASLAEGMAQAWDDGLPPLAIASDTPGRFGSHGLTEVAGTTLRNQREDGEPTRGMVLVLCEGTQVPDRQSLNLFEPVSPGLLLDSPEGLSLLAQQRPPLALDGPLRAVRQAITSTAVAARPSAISVAAYFDRVAGGDDALAALPALGGFADVVSPGTRIEADRIADNLLLASARMSEDLLHPTAYADVRRRAGAVLGRRPALRGSRTQLLALVDEVMMLLQAGDDRLLQVLAFDEAKEILEQRPNDLAKQVVEELLVYQRGLPRDGQAAALPWESYLRRAEALRQSAQQRDAARELCDLDDSLQRQAFQLATRTKLERLLRDKAVNASRPSCPEAGLIKAAQQLGGMIQRVQVLAPSLPSGNARTTRTGAGRLLTLAVARMRLGGLMRRWHNAGGEIDGLLLRAADEGDVVATFGDADLGGPGQLPALSVRLYGDDDSTVQVDWRPDLDDVAMLRALLLFAEQPLLTLQVPDEPTLRTFCSCDHPSPVLPLPAELLPLAQQLARSARAMLDRGLEPLLLRQWVQAWRGTCDEQEALGRVELAGGLTLAGGVVQSNQASAALTVLAPLKAEWLAQYLEALWDLLNRAEAPDTVGEPVSMAATGVALTTASHHPAHLRLGTQDRALLPTAEGRVWSLYGGISSHDESGYTADAITSILARLLTLQPEAAGHLRCLAWGPGAADMLADQAVRIIGTKPGRTKAEVRKVEIFCIGSQPQDRPRWETLVWADEELRGRRDVLELRYLPGLESAREVLAVGSDAPAVHLALVTGLTDGGRRLTIESPEVAPPILDEEVLFAPRIWQRARQERRTLLMPPATTRAGIAWLRLQNAVEDAWPDTKDLLRVPEVRTGTLDIATQLREIHELALWVATLDRYATRDSLEQALGRGNVAILHQDRRLGGDSPLSLVLSQKSGGPADRAIGRSLRAAGIVADAEVALSIGTDIREVASEGYGILALEAATSGAGINELVGHVVAFSLLATTATPWPLPPGCRVLLLSLDEYRHWFPGKRADLLAIALDPREGGVHVAVIEVKARRSDEIDAAGGALDQLNQTLAATRWAAYPQQGSVYSRLWLNRLTEAAYAVARESRFRLDADEIAALESFRLGTGTLEWAGVGLVFGPNVREFRRHYPQQVDVDIVPVALHSIKLTEELLRAATSVSLKDLRTVEASAPPLEGGRLRRRPETKPEIEEPDQTTPGGASDPGVASTNEIGSMDPAEVYLPAVLAGEEPELSPSGSPNALVDVPSRLTATAPAFVAPLLGWDAVTGEEVRWHAAGVGPQVLQNGHTEIWGSSGMGKTQFTMSLLSQLAHRSGSHFGVADFKNDYSSDTGFPAFADAEFIDLWNEGANYNPLALDTESPRAIESAVIELRDTVEEATRSFTRMGVRQKAKLYAALQSAYSVRQSEGRWPTLLTLDDHLDADLAGVMGDLTRHELFREGPPLGDVIQKNVVFGLSRIPGNGQTTVLAAGFILSALLLRVQNLTPTANTIRYLAVVDEAHRVADFQAIRTMIREGRSKGLAVVLATQQPLDLPAVVAANAATKICFGLPDANVATMAARKLQPDNARLSEQIRTLGAGEAFVSLQGEAPRLLTMTQAYRDWATLGLPALSP